MNFMDRNERNCCKRWIHRFICDHPQKTNDSYVLKHMFQRMTGIYSSDEEFQNVMRECGYSSLAGRRSVFNVCVDPEVIAACYYRNNNGQGLKSLHKRGYGYDR